VGNGRTSALPNEFTVKHRLRGWLLGLLLAFASAATAAETSAPTTATLQQTVVTEFYSWYLHGLINNTDPLHDDPATMAKYVSAALAKEIEKKINSPDGMESDYFIQAQDYMDDWVSNISATPPAVKGMTANIVVRLGAPGNDPYLLDVALVNEQGAWKIRRVALHRASRR